MKRLMTLLALLLLTGCTALPAEERSFAVALGISRSGAAWMAHARIPTYQTGGGYMTVSGEGDTPGAALAALDAACPMELQTGQLRMVVFSAELAQSGDFPAALEELRRRGELRMDAYAAVTETDMQALMDAMEPLTGARLSKSLDVLMETRSSQGTVAACRLRELLETGERQQQVVAAMRLEDGAIALSGGWPISADGWASQRLTPEETQLLALMQGRLTQGTLTLAEGVVRLTGVTAEAEVAQPLMHQASVRLSMAVSASPLTEDALGQAVATACLGLLNRLSAMGCDALGLGRQVILHVQDMAEWRELDWPARYRELEWSVSVGVTGPA